MPPDGSSTRSSLQENTPPSMKSKDPSTPPDYSDSSVCSEESEERRESLSHTSTLPRPSCYHPNNSGIQVGNPRSYAQQPSYAHSMPPSMAYTTRLDGVHGLMHPSHHPPSSVVSMASSHHQQQQQPFNQPAHMFNNLPHIDRQLLERQQMDRLQAMERQKQMERQLPMSRPNLMEFDRQFQYLSSQAPPVPTGTQRPHAVYPRGGQDWSPNINAGRQRSYTCQEETMLLKERQVEAQRRLMQQENSRRLYMPQQGGVYHTESLQHLHMLPGHSDPHHRYPLNYHSIEEPHHPGHIGPYLHQSGGRHSYSAVPSGRDLLGPPMSVHHQHGSLQRPHRVVHHSGFSGSSQQPPPPNHEQSDKKNFSVIQV